MHIGCHLSVAGGYRQLCADALQIGADTFQFFTRNLRGGSGRVPTDEELAVSMNRLPKIPGVQE